MVRWRQHATYGALALAGALAVWGGCVARGRWEPSSVEWDGDRYEVVRREVAQGIDFELVRGGRVVETLGGSTDTLCDPPFIYVVDVDQDGRRDVYHHHCGGHGFLRHVPRTRQLEYVNLGSVEREDAPGLDSYWAGEVRARGLRLTVLGAMALVAAAIGAGVSLQRARDAEERERAGNRAAEDSV